MGLNLKQLGLGDLFHPWHGGPTKGDGFKERMAVTCHSLTRIGLVCAIRKRLLTWWWLFSATVNNGSLSPQVKLKLMEFLTT